MEEGAKAREEARPDFAPLCRPEQLALTLAGELEVRVRVVVVIVVLHHDSPPGPLDERKIVSADLQTRSVTASRGEV
jgi:hypothetical protein